MSLITGSLRGLTLFSAVVAFGLGGCSYFDVPQSANTNGSGEVIDITTGQTLRAAQPGLSSPGLVQEQESVFDAPATNASKSYSFSMINPIPRPASNASVEVYSLDGPAHSYSYVNNSPSVQLPVINNQLLPLTPESQSTESGAGPIQLIPPSATDSSK